MSHSDYSYVIRAKTRRMIILALKEKRIPSQLAKELHLSLVSVSRSLSGLAKRKLVKCITPKETHGRIYVLSDTGRKLRGELEKCSIKKG